MGEQHWRVVGGGAKGGIIVREGKDTKSRELGRLQTGSLVSGRQEVGTERLEYRLVEGDGPAQGWVSLRLKEVALLVQEEVAERPPALDTAALAQAPAQEVPQGRPTFAPESGGSVAPVELEAGSSRAIAASKAEVYWSDDARRVPAIVDVAILDRFLLEEHDDRTAGRNLDPPGDYKGGQLPVMPRTVGLPTHAALPEKAQKSFPDRTNRRPMIRLYCLTGAADNYMLWLEFATAAPEWCEVAVYEPRAHGFRKEEAWDTSLEERAEDAFRVMRPALETHSRGGISEGAPFGLLAHGVGSQLLPLLAQRMRRALSIEPLVVFANDGPPPNCRTLSDEGYEFLCRDVYRFYQLFQPETARHVDKMGRDTVGAQQLLRKWSRGLRLFEEHAQRCLARKDAIYHKFRCDLHVLIAQHTQDLDGAAAALLPPEAATAWQARKPLTASPPESGVMWTEEMMRRWVAWTEEDCLVHQVPTDHMSIKNSKLLQEIVFRELAGFCGMDY